MYGYDHDYERACALEDGEYDADNYTAEELDDIAIADRERDEEDARENDEDDDRSDFADPGGRSALRAATRSNPRNLPCPTCGAENRLTPADRAQGYQCDSCADRDEGTYVGVDY
jgi:hypothetical protein